VGRRHPALASLVRRLAAEIGVFSDFVAMDAVAVLDLVASRLESGERLELRHEQALRRNSEMGLDITAYSKCEFHGKRGPEDYWANNMVRVYQQHGHHAERLDGKEVGFYKRLPGSEEHAFRAGSYSGYNEWRATLCRFVHEVSPERVWEDYETYKGKPFIELIHFSDCEGAIGPVTSAKLAKDFAEWEERLKKKAHRDDAWWFERYGNWKKAFELAADGGFVTFH
jgi:hypothetical protein